MNPIIKIFTALVIFCNTNISLAAKDEAPVVTLPQGQIRGRVLFSYEGNKRYYAYQEIPYAAPPVGKRRFKEPVQHENWEGVLNTTHNTRSCFQSGSIHKFSSDVIESEDCLYLNVYTPVKPGTNSDPLPVLFWIHGGAFILGTGTFQHFGPQFLINYDIVIVTFNYRLGALGFLTTEDDVIPGNLGLKDQHFALKWVKRNIRLFGGDPTKTTIAGESAGGCSVGHLIGSKKSKGLFRAAVLQSGTSIFSVVFQPYAKFFAFKLGSSLDPSFTSENSLALLELLQSASAADISKIRLDIPEDKVVGQDKGLIWLPVIESHKSEGSFVSSPMYDSIRTGNINRVPILIGFNSEEALLFSGGTAIGNFTKMAINMDNDPAKVANQYNMSTENKDIAGRALKQFYTTSFQQNFSAVVKYVSDSKFIIPVVRHAELQSNYTDVFLYEFSYKGPMGRINITIDGTDSVAHAEELKYFWHVDRLDDGTTFPADDLRTQRRLLRLWSNFVKYLNPTPKEDPLFQNILWPKVTPGNVIYVNINRCLGVNTNPRRYQQFTTIVDKYVVPPLIVY